MFQFCPRCQRLVIRAGGCNHIACLCGYDFCVICGGHWPVGGVEPPCHPYFGAHDEHVLQVPAEIQARLDEEERQPPDAAACRHPPGLLYTLRFRRELSVEERSEAQCDDCGRVARAFLLQCIGCRALLCLSCRDAVWAE
ncbi:hypothetical protein F5144DRAFT_37897 [Chaetomium tenue]|uniref:Uncharacterized protein n=1 Tax=Chaetomium tenue TaxID=1854479 RepID=A0ACB7PPH3_9PEZI|nr:hypothetical protein F5144DRAFT_37897 [Chaetomium globosum]